MYEEVCYEKPFLKEVIVRIDYLAPIEGLERALPAKLAKVASDRFPIAEPAEGLAQELQLGAGEIHHKETRFKHWNFFGKDREKQFSLAAPSMFVTHSRYSTYEVLKEDWSAVVDAVAKAFPEVRAGRFGLRYVNHIEIEGIPPTAWADYIAADLIQADAFFYKPVHLTRLLHLAELRYGDLQLRFQFGMPNPDFPAVVRRPLFILDFDAYIQVAQDLPESLNLMDEAHGRIQELFEQSITNPLRERMNAIAAAPLQ